MINTSMYEPSRGIATTYMERRVAGVRWRAGERLPDSVIRSPDAQLLESPRLGDFIFNSYEDQVYRQNPRFGA